MRASPLVAFAVVACVVAAACGGDDSTNGGASSTVPPPNCMSPCSSVGSVCYGPVENNCNGSWYCWSDSAWHCAPQDGGGAPDATLFDTGFSDDGPEETGPVESGAVETGAGEAGTRDAGPG